MSDPSDKRINTNYVGLHISSGGFIFYKDKKTGELFTLLIKNKKGECWIPKGHLEEGEDQVSAAYREIEEEVTLKKSQLRYVGFCCMFKYSYMENNGINYKEVYFNVFESFEKNKLSHGEGETDIVDIEWFEYSKALQVISFNKKELAESKEIFDKSISN